MTAMRFLFDQLFSFFSEILNTCMKTFKIADLFISAGLIVLFTVLILNGELDNEHALAYMTIGGWQLISMYTHVLKRWFTKAGGVRYYYHRVVAYFVPSVLPFSMLCHSLSFISDKLRWQIVNTFMDTCCVVMALFYTTLCLVELCSSSLTSLTHKSGQHENA